MAIGLMLLAAVVVLGPPAWACICWAQAVRGRALSAVERAAVAFASVGVSTWAVWVAASALGMSMPVILGAVALVTVVLWLDARRLAARAERLPLVSVGGDGRVVAVVALLSVALLLPAFLTFGLERADGVHTLAMTDWYKHLVVAAGIDGSSSFPPVNPFSSLDPDPSYYFGFHLLAASLRRVAGVEFDIYWVLLGLTLLTGAVFPAVVYLFALDLSDRPRAIAAAAGATLLAGFDVLVVGIDTVRNLVGRWPLPAGVAGLRALIPSTHLDYWVHHNERQFSGAYVTTAWAPQHSMAVLLALLIVWLQAPRPGEAAAPRHRWLLPAILIAALPAISAYVAIALGFGVGVYVLAGAIGSRVAVRRLPAARRWLVPGLAGAVLALPVLRVLASGQGSSSGLVLAISGSGGWSNGAVFNALFGSYWWTNLLDTPAVYTIELGVVGVLGVLEILRRRRREELSPAQQQAAVILAAILVLVTFVRPPLDGPNNLYARPMLLVFCLLTPFAAMAAAKAPRGWVRAAVLAGALGTAYALVGIVLQGAMFFASPGPQVQAGAWINANTSPAAVVAIAPEQFNRYFGFWVRRSFVLADERHARLLGASAEQNSDTAAALVVAFDAMDGAEAARRFDFLGADTILVRRPTITGAPQQSPISNQQPRWARRPCFEIPYSNADWLVVTRLTGQCGG